jgi:predicted permease
VPIILLNVIAPVALVTLAGFLWGLAKRPFDAVTFSLIATIVGTPCLVIESLASSNLQLGPLADMGLGALLCVLASLALGAVVVLALRRRMSVFLPATTFANTANIGLPVALFAFGPEGLALAVAYFAVHSVMMFSIGNALAAGRLSSREILLSPMIWAAIFGAVLSITGTGLPLPLARAVHILGGLTIPMMLLALGVSLSRLKVRSLGWGFLFAMVRLCGGFAIGCGVAWLLGVHGTARGVMVIQSAMPAAVYNYMFAARHGNDPEEVASLVVTSTLLAVVLLPLFLNWVM